MFFFEKQTKKSLKKAIKKFEQINFDSEYIRKTALVFSEKRFKARIKEEVYKQFKKIKKLKKQNENY